MSIFVLRSCFQMPSNVCVVLLGMGMFLGMPEANAQKPVLVCPAPKGERQVHEFAAYTVRLLRSSARGDRCQALITSHGSKAGAEKKVATDWALSINALSGTDINGDGKPELIVQGYSGAAHCCYTYRIVGLTDGLPLIHEIRNQVPVIFKHRDDGGVELQTGEGVFDYFLVPHANSVIPQLFMRLDGDNLVDLSAEHLADYDREIEKARGELTSEEREKLKSSTYSQGMLFDQLPAVQKVLTIVLNYLYSGRQEDAWHALEEMWPPADKERVEKLILERRSRGLLSRTNEKPKAGL
jgi:hypothetical protein